MLCVYVRRVFSYLSDGLNLEYNTCFRSAKGTSKGVIGIVGQGQTREDDYCMITAPRQSNIQGRSLTTDQTDPVILVRSSAVTSSFQEDGQPDFNSFRLLNEGYSSRNGTPQSIERLAQLYSHGIQMADRLMLLHMHHYLINNQKDQFKKTKKSDTSDKGNILQAYYGAHE